ncbi:MAG: Uma2 family endonuclease [Oscillospiraceae bacterium]|nr:Uma2 family endonuclease [Oscillospiraceae bacterium]
MEVSEAVPEYKSYTYADYCTWGDERWELVDGEAYAMAPGPSEAHQSVLLNLARKLSDYLEGKPCKVFVAPFDVRLNADTYDDTVVQPDILVVCDEKKLDGKSCVGAPDLVVEILSPSTATRDKTIKFKAYLQAGVREYWMADPETKSISAHVLENGRYYTTIYFDNDTVPVHILEGCAIELAKVFAE